MYTYSLDAFSEKLQSQCVVLRMKEKLSIYCWASVNSLHMQTILCTAITGQYGATVRGTVVSVHRDWTSPELGTEGGCSDHTACTNKKKKMKKATLISPRLKPQQTAQTRIAVKLHNFLKVTDEIVAFILSLAWSHFFLDRCCQRGMRHEPRHQLLFTNLHCSAET